MDRGSSTWECHTYTTAALFLPSFPVIMVSFYLISFEAAMSTTTPCVGFARLRCCLGEPVCTVLTHFHPLERLKPEEHDMALLPPLSQMRTTGSPVVFQSGDWSSSVTPSPPSSCPTGRCPLLTALLHIDRRLEGGLR